VISLADNQRLEAAQPIVLEDGTMAQAFRTWALNVTDNITIIGTGTPEGIVEAPQFSTYIDQDGSTGTILYIKKLAQITDDIKKGWILV